ncbi:hypothetical protein GII36_00525 [Candidatus Mycosynbacter amalyticus]|uniref:Uncharacterized protein n=1 Tax=Candidatus Mycosynbacter amalyticus TaxID=2665156 RepID=A0A857MIG6_9BACT|nr:hypothetical protein [Candidatus Mycosynbacter amalyticus]QHN42343.1 hypothetical protein GII36_00525 [Candidatus Mycosynbacter amalyticus]
MCEVDAEKWTEEQAKAVQDYLERHVDQFRTCFHEACCLRQLVSDGDPVTSWQYIHDVMSCPYDERCAFENIYLNGAHGGIQTLLGLKVA